jgi:hypothetical protein
MSFSIEALRVGMLHALRATSEPMFIIALCRLELRTCSWMPCGATCLMSTLIKRALLWTRATGLFGELTVPVFFDVRGFQFLAFFLKEPWVLGIH